MNAEHKLNQETLNIKPLGKPKRTKNTNLARKLANKELQESGDHLPKREKTRRQKQRLENLSTADCSTGLMTSAVHADLKRKTITEEDIQQVKTRISFEEVANSHSRETRMESESVPIKEEGMEEEIDYTKAQLAKAPSPSNNPAKMEIEEAKFQEETGVIGSQSTIDEYFQSLRSQTIPQNKVVNQVYSKRILFNLCSKEASLTPKAFLKNHNIMPNHRARMCDWMTEVLGNYSASEQTFFLAISILDRYFASQTRKLQPTELHIAGCVAMLIASKYEEVSPLKLSVLVGKIAHNKISAEEVIRVESEIMAVIGFRAWAPTAYEMFNNLVSLMEFRSVLNALQFNHFKATAIYLFKMCLYHYELVSCHSYFELVIGVFVISLKTCLEAFPNERHDMFKIIGDLKEALGINDDSAFDVAKEIVYLAQNFKKIYPSLQNLAKFNTV